MKVLVTGATGFVGRHLVKRLKEEHINVTEINSTNFSSMWSLEKNTYDYIFHLAVKTSAGGYCQKHPGEQWIVNSSINTDMLAYWAQYQQRATMITFGSSCGYSNDVKKTESNYLLGAPETGYEVYGMVKRYLLTGIAALKEEFKMDFRYLIPSVFYGPDYDLNDKHFIFDLIRKIVNAKNGGDEVVLWGDGTQTRELIFIDDAVDIIIKAMEWDLDIVNLSSGKEHPIREYAKAICNIVGYDSSNINYDITKFVGSKSKNLINTHLTDFEFTSLEEGLKQTITYYENRISSSK